MQVPQAVGRAEAIAWNKSRGERRPRRRIQVEDGTFVGSEWMIRELPEELLSNAPGSRSKMWAMGIVAALAVGVAIDAALLGQWGRVVLWMCIIGIGVFRNVRAMRRCPLFEARFTVLAAGVGLCGMFTLLIYDLPLFRWQAGAGMSTHILFNAAVVLIYATLIGILVWMPSRDS